MDNLNTHAFGSLFATYPPDEAWRLARRLEFHFTPKHASWLNMAECELSVLARQCLDQRIDSPARLESEILRVGTTPQPTTGPRRLAIHRRRRPDDQAQTTLPRAIARKLNRTKTDH